MLNAVYTSSAATLPDEAAYRVPFVQVSTGPGEQGVSSRLVPEHG